MSIRPVLFFLLTFIHFYAFPQAGCPDPQATNFDPAAIINDGSCLYPVTTLSLNVLTNLDTPILNESSGVIMLDGNLWSHVDNTDASIYQIDSLNPAILQSVNINAATNTDWEDLAKSNDHLYIGDIGNNSGNRTDLHILKIAKADITPTTVNVNAEYIYYSYPDQTDFTPLLNNNSFDCEAFFFFNDSLHLFTKDWVNKITKHYVIPAMAGTYVAALVDSFNVNGLISSAAIQDDGLITLLGYDNTGFAPCFMLMLYDYQNYSFFSGNKRFFSLGSAATLGQLEGIELRGDNFGYITNEKFQQLIFNVPAQLKSFDLSSYLPAITSFIATANNQRILFKAYPVPSSELLTVSIQPFIKEENYIFLVKDMNGKTIMEKPLVDDITRFSIANFINGVYEGKIYLMSNLVASLRFVKN